MADEGRFTLHYITDFLLGSKTANIVAKIEMAKAFCKLDQTEKLYFYNLVESKEVLESFHLTDISEKLIVKPLLAKGYDAKILPSRSFWSFCYEFIFVSPKVLLRAFLLALTLKKTSKVYIRALESLFGFYLGSFITNAKFAFEQDSFSFGEFRTADFLFRKIIKRAKFIVTISEYTKSNWVNNGIPESKIIVLPSGVNIEDFNSINKGTDQLRKELGLANDKKIITYAGGLYENRGIEELLYCASKYEDYLFLFLGGTEEHIKRYKSYIQSQFQRQLPNVIFRGYVKHDMVASYLKASDILAAPYSKKIKTVHHMSPIKLIEYIASKVPVIASDLPRMRDIASEDEVTFFQPDNSNDLLEKIAAVFDNYEQARSKALKAYEKAKNLTWDKRAEKIVNLLQNRPNQRR